MKYLKFSITIIVCFLMFAVAGGFLLNAVMYNSTASASLSTVEILKLLNDDASRPTNDTDPGVPQSFVTDSYNILLLVPDVASGCTDTIMVINYDPTVCRISILSIPRDTCITAPNGSRDKINSIYAVYGVKTLCNYIKEVSGVDINYYFILNISTVRDIVDYVGGVYYDLPVDLYYVDEGQDLLIDLQAGYQLFNGAKAEQLLRFREFNTWYRPTRAQTEYYSGSDMNRIRTQINFVKEAIDQKFNLRYMADANSLISILMNGSETNISADMLTSILATTVNSFNDTFSVENNVFSFYLGGEADYRYSSYYGKDLYFWITDGTVCMSGTDKVYSTEKIVNLLFSNNKTSVLN